MTLQKEEILTGIPFLATAGMTPASAPVDSSARRVSFVSPGIAFAALVAVFAFTALAQAGSLYFLYTWLFGWVVEYTGLDLWTSRSLTLLVLTLLFVFPWQVLSAAAKRMRGATA